VRQDSKRKESAIVDRKNLIEQGRNKAVQKNKNGNGNKVQERIRIRVQQKRRIKTESKKQVTSPKKIKKNKKETAIDKGLAKGRSSKATFWSSKSCCLGLN
jgi:hypothetical protein